MTRKLSLLCLLFVFVSWNYAGSAAQTREMKAYAETIPGSEIKFDMMPIPGGAFIIGSPDDETDRSNDEGPQREVTIRPFWMSATEVTWDQYDPFAFSMGIKKEVASDQQKPEGVDAITRPTPPYADESFGYGKGRQPVISITHHAAMEYCRWLSQKTGKTYRLPTEAEWEYACRAGTKSVYSFGDGAKKLDEHAWYFDNSGERPHPVGAKEPNAWGLHDMHGNVAEWCLDQYDAGFYSTLASGKATLSPVSIPGGNRYPHAVRGGSWDDEAALLRSAARRASRESWSRRDPQIPQSIWWHTDATFVGFRIVRALEEQENLRGLKSKVTKQSK